MMKSIRIFLPLFFLFLCSQLDAQNRYNLFYENRFSATTGAENMLSFHKAIYSAESHYLSARFFDENTNGRKALGIGYRLSKTVLLDIPLDDLTGLFVHECFGHGARYREFGYTENHFHISLPPPYGKGKGISYSGTPGPGRSISSYERLAMTFSGSQANTIAANMLELKWMQRDSIHYREATYYAGAFNDLTYYILSTIHLKKHGNDIENYINRFNSISDPAYTDPSKRYTEEQLGKQVCYNFLNPFQYIAAWVYLKDYLVKGREYGKLPLFHFKEIAYLPSFHFSLTPFGSAFHFDNYLRYKNRVADISFHYGDPKKNQFYGGAVSVYPVVSGKYFYLNGKLCWWNQPRMQLGGKTIHDSRKGLGGEALLTAGFSFFPKTVPVNLVLQTGYKTDGFYEGETLAKGFILRFGLSFNE